jgi:membrane-bound metal-dependent hydrolase YbcI (DUF457 family)
MPSTIGHAIAGAAVAWGADAVGGGSHSGADRRPSLALTCAAIAAAPDLDLLFHTHRTATHSVGATILVALVAGAVAARARLPIVRVAIVCGAAHASHVLLDWLGVDPFPPYGIQALWPFSNGWFISGLDVFRQTARRQFLSEGSIRTNALAVAQEIAILGPVGWAAWSVRVKALSRLAAQLPGGDHPPE